MLPKEYLFHALRALVRRAKQADQFISTLQFSLIRFFKFAWVNHAATKRNSLRLLFGNTLGSNRTRTCIWSDWKWKRSCTIAHGNLVLQVSMSKACVPPGHKYFLFCNWIKNNFSTIFTHNILFQKLYLKQIIINS